LPPNVSLEDQIGLFRGEYSGDFAGNDWQDKGRGLGQQRRLKRHRNAAIEHARQELAQGKLEAFLEQKDYGGAWRSVADVLAATDLAAPRQVETLRGRADRATAQSVEVLINMLYGEAAFAECFDSYVKEMRRVLGVTPSWELATGIPALVHPEVHLCVRKSSFQKQAELRLAPLANAARPNSTGYMGFLELATGIMDELKKNEAKPEDFLDIHDFVKHTTTPSALRRIEAVRRAVNRASSTDQSSVADA
jgi:hypothetical protein